MRYEDIHEVCFETQWLEQARALYKEIGHFRDPDAPLLDMQKVTQLLEGAIDTHVHPGPDALILRPLDGAEIAIQACEMGMGAVVYKSSRRPTVCEARLAQKIVDQWANEHGKKSTKVIGGIVLGYAVGGLNAVAVRNAVKIGGKFVWTPVTDSSHHHKISGRAGGIEVIGKGDEVVPQLREIFKIIARYDAVLVLCHHSTRERFIMIDDAKEEGVKRISIVHPTESLTKMSIAQMKMAAEKGAYLELCCVDFGRPEVIWDEWLEVIKEVGADHIILASDCGSWAFPPPATQYRSLIIRLLQSGVPEADIEKMVKINARNLIF